MELDNCAGGSILLVWTDWNVGDRRGESDPDEVFDHGLKEDFLRRYVDGHVPCIYFVEEEERVEGQSIVDLAYDKS